MNIKSLRKSQNLTIQALADKLGVDRITVYRWENKHVKPHPIIKEKLLRLLKNKTK